MVGPLYVLQPDVEFAFLTPPDSAVELNALIQEAKQEIDAGHLMRGRRLEKLDHLLTMRMNRECYPAPSVSAQNGG